MLSAGCSISPELSGEGPAQPARSAPTLSWSEILPASSLTVAAIGERDAIVAGTFTGALAIGDERLVARSASDLFVSRMDASGRHRWTKQLGAADHISSTAAGRSDLVLAGTSERGADLGGGALGAGAFLAKLDGSGGHVWSKSVAGAKDVPRVRVDRAGDVVALLRTDGPIDLGGGPIASASGTIVAKLDARGRPLWSKTYGPEVTMMDVAVTRGGDVIATGSLKGRIDFGGGPIATEEGSRDAILVRYDPEGHHRWSRRFGEPSDVQDARRVVVDDAGNLFVEQKEESGPILGLYKYDARGELLWRRALGVDSMTASAADHAGDVAYATFNLTTAGASIVLLDRDGHPVWSRTLSEDDDVEIEDMDVVASSTLLVAGRVNGAIDLWGPIASPDGQSTRFVAALTLDR